MLPLDQVAGMRLDAGSRRLLLLRGAEPSIGPRPPPRLRGVA